MKRRETVDTWVRVILIAFSALVVLVPLYFTVLNSFKPYREIASNIAAWPQNPTLDNFKEAWERLDFLNVLKNTAIITIFSALGCVVFSGMTGYWIARNRNRFTKIWNVLFLSGMCVPFQCIMIVFAKMIGMLKLGNHLFGVILSLGTVSANVYVSRIRRGKICPAGNRRSSDHRWLQHLERILAYCVPADSRHCFYNCFA